ncbi:MAG: response regulator [Proteobacteria bacterium]|nr:response regulator [Pseudomonadota bacterium]
MSQSYPKFDRSLVVLHVDDDPMNLRVVEEILGAFGHTAIKATNGLDALKRLSERAFDVVLMDIHMPGMTGIETVARLRKLSGPEAQVPVIALTADVFSRRPDEYRALGFTDFVAKPILVSGLLEAVKRATEACAGASAKSSGAANAA